MDLAENSVPHFCPHSIGQHLVTWSHRAAGKVGKCSPPVCPGGKHLTLEFLFLTMKLCLGQVPCQPGGTRKYHWAGTGPGGGSGRELAGGQQGQEQEGE